LIDKLVAATVRRRRAAFAAHPERRRALARPVISIGNLAMGGSGKTPLVSHVARALQSLGYRPSVLSRGYARPRPLDGAVVVSDGARILATYDTAGDEPLMLARQLPGCIVVVAPDRYLAGTFAERRLGCTVHVLDDGFQHLQLARTLDILVVTRRDLEDRVMPRGRLREPLDAMHAADAVVVPAEEDLEDAVRAAGATRVFRMSRRLAEGRQEAVFAFAGIGRPAAFFDDLAREGWSVVGSRAFADHHRYSATEVSTLSDEARRAGATLLVTTEKDAARLEGVRPEMPIAAVPLAVTVEPAQQFAAWLDAACSEPRR
jgi:tetraacyldisaccharide 4'-kinase